MPRSSFKGDIDLSGVRPAEGVTTIRKGQDLSEYVRVLTDSWNQATDGKGAIMELAIPEAARKLVESRLRQAGKELGVGVATGDVPHPDGNGLIVLRFQAKAKVERKPGATAKAKAAQAPATAKGLPKVGAA